MRDRGEMPCRKQPSPADLGAGYVAGEDMSPECVDEMRIYRHVEHWARGLFKCTRRRQTIVCKRLYGAFLLKLLQRRSCGWQTTCFGLPLM